MPAPLAKGIIITVSVLIAAGIAAYESPEVRKWVEQSRRKIAMALNSLGEDLSPNLKNPKKHDPSMDEDKSVDAEERRRQIRAELLERGRILEEKRRRQRDSGVGSFDSLVDDEGNLRKDLASETTRANATTTAVDQGASTGGLTKRNAGSSQHGQESGSSAIQADFLATSATSGHLQSAPWSSYENELREQWNLPLPPITTAASETSHASESLLDLTPTSEFPDPDVSVPESRSPTQSLTHSAVQQHQREYFSMPRPQSDSSQTQPQPQPQPQPSSSRSRTLSPSQHHPSSPSIMSDDSSSYYYAHPSAPDQPLPHPSQARSSHHRPSAALSPIILSGPSSAASIADTSDLEHVHASDVSNASISSGVSVNGFESENDDGIRTPEGSQWTDVSSVVSGDR